MSEHDSGGHVETLSLSREEQWTLHHVLLDRLGFGRDTGSPSLGSDLAGDGADVRRAFETLDAGGERDEDGYTLAELEAIQCVLAAYHHSPTWWEVERPRLERLLHRVSAAIERGRGSYRTDDRRST
jgi:hypothetical protein